MKVHHCFFFEIHKVLLVVVFIVVVVQARLDHQNHEGTTARVVVASRETDVDLAVYDFAWKIKLQQEDQQESEAAEELFSTNKRDVRLAIILGSFSVLIALLVCGPLFCICYGAKRIRDMRRKTAAIHSHIFAEQWRANNLFMPFHEDEELGQASVSWSAWQFVYRGIPDEFNGLSTAIFQSIPPVSGYISSSSSPSAPFLQQIRLNPGCARLRRSQSLQCLLPLLPIPCSHPAPEIINRRLMLPYVSYFEMTIQSFCRNGTSGRSSGTIYGRVAIGLAARPSPPFRLPGLDMVSLGYHSNGCIYINDPHDGVHVSRRWNYVGVTVGCGFDLEKCLVYFTLNGAQQIYTDFAFRADGTVPSTIPHLFPVVAADCDVTVIVNLGQSEFAFAAANATRCIAFDQQEQQERQQQQQQQLQQQQKQRQLEMIAMKKQQQQPLLDDHRLQDREQQQQRSTLEQTSRSESSAEEVYYSASDEPTVAAAVPAASSGSRTSSF